MARAIIFNYPEQNLTAVAPFQNPGDTGGVLVLSSNPVIFSGFSSALSITALGGDDWSAIVFRVTGTDRDGNPQTRAYLGPTPASATVYYNNQFRTVTGVTADGFVALGSISMGTGNAAISDWFPMSTNNISAGFSVQTFVSLGYTYTIEKTLMINQGYDFPASSIVAYPFDSAHINQTASTFLTQSGYPIAAIRVNFSIVPDSGDASVIVVQQGIV